MAHASLLAEKKPSGQEKYKTNTFCVPVHTLDIPVHGETVFFAPTPKKQKQKQEHRSPQFRYGWMSIYEYRHRMPKKKSSESSRCQTMKLQQGASFTPSTISK